MGGAVMGGVVRSRGLVGGGGLRVGGWLGDGGEAVVYGLVQPAGCVLKEYSERVVADRGAELEAKLRVMVASPPREPGGGHASIVWPLDLAVDGAGVVCGFVMPEVDRAKSVELHQVQNPSDRRRGDRVTRERLPGWLSGFTWRYLIRVAANLSNAVAAVHDADYVIGDFNGRNVLVSDGALVTVVDCDSFQVRAGDGRVFFCEVQLPGTQPPELIGRDLLGRCVRRRATCICLLCISMAC